MLEPAKADTILCNIQLRIRVLCCCPQGTGQADPAFRNPDQAPSDHTPRFLPPRAGRAFRLPCSLFRPSSHADGLCLATKGVGCDFSRSGCLDAQQSLGGGFFPSSPFFLRYVPDPDNGMWVMTRTPDHFGSAPSLSVIHIDSIFCAVHLLPIFDTTPVPRALNYTQSLNSFKGFYVNNYIDYHAYETVL
jgi:hypothetical protein